MTPGHDSEGWDSFLSLFHTAADCMKAHVRIVQGITGFPGFVDDLNGVAHSHFITLRSRMQRDIC